MSKSPHQRKEPEWLDHEFTDNVICPYCSYDMGNDDMGDKGDLTCDECGEEFHYEADYTVTYSTSKRKTDA